MKESEYQEPFYSHLLDSAFVFTRFRGRIVCVRLVDAKGAAVKVVHPRPVWADTRSTTGCRAAGLILDNGLAPRRRGRWRLANSRQRFPSFGRNMEGTYPALFAYSWSPST